MYKYVCVYIPINPRLLPRPSDVAVARDGVDEGPDEATGEAGPGADGHGVVLEEHPWLQ